MAPTYSRMCIIDFMVLVGENINVSLHCQKVAIFDSIMFSPMKDINDI